jgi:hypothetical protein
MEEGQERVRGTLGWVGGGLGGGGAKLGSGILGWAMREVDRVSMTEVEWDGSEWRWCWWEEEEE